jgi:hypothetical protein
MTKKRQVLEIFYATQYLLTPDGVRARLRGYQRRCSVYSYLLRLSRQGLLLRTQIGSRIAYRITPRGVARLLYLRKGEQSE